jgi:hypothetical protein
VQLSADGPSWGLWRLRPGPRHGSRGAGWPPGQCHGPGSPGGECSLRPAG